MTHQEDKDFERAFLALIKRRFDAPVDLWEAFIEGYPARPGAQGDLAICLLNCSRPEEALASARKSLDQHTTQATLLLPCQALAANGLSEETEADGKTGFPGSATFRSSRILKDSACSGWPRSPRPPP